VIEDSISATDKLMPLLPDALGVPSPAGKAFGERYFAVQASNGHAEALRFVY